MVDLIMVSAELEWKVLMY